MLSNIQILEFTKELWEVHKDGIMNIEKECFDSTLAMSEEQIFSDCCSEDSIVFLALDNNSLVGCIWANNLDDKNSSFLDDCWNPKEYKHYGEGVAYISSLGVLPKYRGMGIAKQLNQYAIDKIKTLNYKWLLSHSRNGAMAHISESLSMRKIKEEKNWGGSGETHYLMEMYLAIENEAKSL